MDDLEYYILNAREQSEKSHDAVIETLDELLSESYQMYDIELVFQSMLRIYENTQK